MRWCEFYLSGGGGKLEYLLAKERLPQEFERLVKDYDAVRESIAANLAEAKKDSPKVCIIWVYHM